MFLSCAFDETSVAAETDALLSSVLQVYRSFGLGSFYSKVMNFNCLLRYSEYGAVGRDLPDFPGRLVEDIYQVRLHNTAHAFMMRWC